MFRHGPSYKRPLIHLSFGIVVATGCAACAHKTQTTKKTASAEQVGDLKKRIEELEKTNGQLSVRLDEMKDEIFLLQDRVESHRLALKRRGFMADRTGDSGTAKAPPPTPKTNYGRGQRPQKQSEIRGRAGHSRSSERKSTSNHPVTRIPLRRRQARGTRRKRQSKKKTRPGTPKRGNSTSASGGTEGTDALNKSDRSKAEGATTGDEKARSENSKSEIVITEEDFQKFAQKTEGQSDESTPSSEADETDGKAKAPVTNERLPTDEAEAKKPSSSVEATTEKSTGTRSPESPEPSNQTPFQGKSGLELYKTALAKYRSGEYQTALRGFRRYMKSGPRKDYRDNTLYWIGECQYGLGEFKQSIDTFQSVLEKEPSGNKVPDAMLKMALAYRELDMKDRARKTLKKLERRYPSTNAGRLGAKKLEELDS